MDEERKARTLNDFSFAIYDLESAEVDVFDPSDDEIIDYGNLKRGSAERAVELLFRRNLQHGVFDMYHKIDNPLQNKVDDSQSDRVTKLREKLQELILRHTSTKRADFALDVVDIDGIPDLLVYEKANPESFWFVEVKQPRERLLETQSQWIDQFNFLPIKIAKVFDRKTERNAFIQNHSVDDILANVQTSRDPEGRPQLSPEEIAARLDIVKEGDEVLFNDRKEAVVVVDTDVTSSGSGDDITGVKVRSSRGNHFVLDNDGGRYRRRYYGHDLWWVKVMR